MTYLKIKKRKSLLQFSEAQKEASYLTLNKYLVDFSNLSLITKQAHWNLQGKNFISVHEMLDEFYSMLQKYTDIFAERLIQMNLPAVATAEHLSRNSSFQEYPPEISSVEEHLYSLLERYSQTANSLRGDIDKAEADAATIDYYTQALEELDKAVWFIEAHLN